VQTDRFWILLLLLLTAPAYFLTLRNDHYWGGDFAVYLQQATNLAEGRPLADRQYAVTPRSALNHPSMYPPVPSLILAPVYAVVGVDYRAMKFALALCWWLALPLWYLVGRRVGLPGPWSAGAVLAFGFGSLPLLLKESIGSDGVYVFSSAAALLAILWLEERGWTAERPALAAAIVAGLLLLNYATRATAAALLVAAVVSEIWRARRLRAYGAYLLGFLAVSIVVYTKLIYDAGGQYGNQFPIDWRNYAHNLLFYFRMPAALWSSSPTLLRYLLAGLGMLCGLVSVVREWRRPSVLEFYLLAFWGMLILYVVSDFRYGLPILPLLLLLAARFLCDFIPKPAAQGLALLLIIGAGFNLRALMHQEPESGPHQSTFGEVVGYLRQAPSDAVLLSWNPRVFSFYTQRRSALYPRTADEWNAEISYLRRREGAGQFLLVVYRHELDDRQLGRYLLEAGSKLTPVFRNADFTVYRLPD